MYHSTKAYIDTSALKYNISKIREHVCSANEKVSIIAVVKADAYGHGAKICAPALFSSGIRDFAVSNLDEALELRNILGKEANILILGFCPPEYAQVLCENDITQTVYSLEYARALCENINDKLNVHIKIDTGMNRLGFSPDESGEREIKKALESKKLTATGIFTHFARADETEKEPTKEQFEKFRYIIDLLEKDGITFKTKHACNSAGIISYPEAYLDAVRCGIIMYGLSPSDEVPAAGLLPVMRLVSRISHIHTVKKGEKISYGGMFTAPHDMRVATLPIGYADGFVRSYSTGGVYINGSFAKILGRICMDQCMVDVTDIPCSVGEEAEIFGKHQSAEVFAKCAGSIGYETTCLIGKRVMREEVSEN